ncbi:MAG: hypothetical protein QOE76_3637 [Frankiales bacterium]|nr:hypothetical protein [Frankiales bacterium]
MSTSTSALSGVRWRSRLVRFQVPTAGQGAGAARALARVGGLLKQAVGPITHVGRVVLALAVVCWVIGWRFGWHEFMVMAATAVFSLVLALVFTLGRTVLAVDLALDPQRVVAGERAGGRIQVRNTSGRRMLPLQVELPVGVAVAAFDVPSLGPDATHEDLFVIPTERRGVVTVGPARGVRSDPLSLLRRAVTLSKPLELYIHPRTINLEGIGAGFLRDLEGQTTNDLSSSDVAFHTLRDYVPGDDRRYVHWRSSAKSGKLMVRQFVDTRRSHVAVVIDGDPAAYADSEEFELAISIGGSLALRALRDEQTVSTVAAGHTVAGVTPRRLLDSLSAVETKPGTNLHAAAIQISRIAADASVAILVTGSQAPHADLRAAANRFGPDVKTVAIRATLGGEVNFTPAGAILLCTVPSLPDLPRLLWAVTRV